MMESYKANKFLFVTSVLSILILLMGTTFSYFTVSNKSEYDAVKVEADKIQLALNIDSLFEEHKLIPTNDSDIITAYKNNCIDKYGYGACLAYKIEVSNFYLQQDLIGTIDFNVTDINHLSYMLLDENENVYMEKKEISNGLSTRQSLGQNFILEDATQSNPSKKIFTLLIWLTNLENEDQTEVDAGGNFTAAISYESVIYGSKLTGTINDFIINEENNNTGVENT